MSAQQPQSTAEGGQPQRQHNQQSFGLPKNVSNEDLLMYLVCFCFPPLAVFWLKGGCKLEVIIDVILWWPFWFPGSFYAFYLVVRSHNLREQEKGPQEKV